MDIGWRFGTGTQEVVCSSSYVTYVLLSDCKDSEHVFERRRLLSAGFNDLQVCQDVWCGLLDQPQSPSFTEPLDNSKKDSNQFQTSHTSTILETSSQPAITEHALTNRTVKKIPAFVEHIWSSRLALQFPRESRRVTARGQKIHKHVFVLFYLDKANNSSQSSNE